ncbi:uncharacterized protein B0H18DRAFT_1046263 [Fomitopsis serialis]|uniref:uncharacterized protein n=1 Tax=Fomitopsis serialis TaxID=139415 RepID=UPI0020088E45|nr:uncharacterized protein B0H18DRAFT_1046263 [Neoantrodia serialis]KAH9914251.1 hypothetical protein B0H18DRAFT_1046263 [Neoantrodia serialis]
MYTQLISSSFAPSSLLLPLSCLLYTEFARTKEPVVASCEDPCRNLSVTVGALRACQLGDSRASGRRSRGCGTYHVLNGTHIPTTCCAMCELFAVRPRVRGSTGRQRVCWQVGARTSERSRGQSRGRVGGQPTEQRRARARGCMRGCMRERTSNRARARRHAGEATDKTARGRGDG